MLKYIMDIPLRADGRRQTYSVPSMRNETLEQPLSLLDCWGLLYTP